jgi:hypothetical protein
MDACSDTTNLTDCLLQLVLDGVEEHNKWDIPSFVVTLVIGAIALCFAAMTVIQGIAGPGRRRSSKNAIGLWSTKCRYSWNWTECRWDSVANTPVLRSSNFILIGPKPNEEPQYKFGDKEKHLASWLHLLEYVNIDNFIWKKFEKQARPASTDYSLSEDQAVTRSTLADYLPAEVQVVPAYIDIDTIVALSAIAGCYKAIIEPQLGYPIMIGKGIQIRFRRDPFLGVVASFENYQSHSKSLDIRNPGSDLSLILTKSHMLETEYGLLRSSSEPLKIANKDLTEPLITFRGELEIDFAEEGSNSRNPCPHVGKNKLCRCWTLFLELIRQHNFAWLLYEKEIVNDIFPAKRAKVGRTLCTIALQGSYWSKDHVFEEWIFGKLKYPSTWADFWNMCTKSQHSNPGEWEIFALCLRFAQDPDIAQNKFFSFPLSLRKRFREGITKEIERVDEKIMSVTKSGSRSSHHTCTLVETYILTATLMTLEPFEESLMKLLYKQQDPAYFLNTGIQSKGGTRVRNVLRLLRGTDVNNEESSFALYNIFHQLFDCWAGELKVLIDSLLHLASKGDQDAAVVESLHENTNIKQPIDIMSKENVPEIKDEGSELLVYRAVLLSTLCLTALDNSDILDQGIGSQVVPFL